ncbi:polysaccharide pyruvyl transferase family protein [Sulfitobacter aestuarii]|uniref:Polysaccharide pyruvyl transferase family protein n=1 Tax=Sulfitobacter aestuarii TaxID=2161676 RepID=A0ABW5U520_9RHOB
MLTVGIFNDTSVTGHYGCTAVMDTLIRELAVRDVKPAYLWPVAEDWHGHLARLEKFRPDMIIVNGEGTIHHSLERKRTRDLLDIAPYARDRGLPAHLINASIADLDPLALDALRGFTSIHVRESESLDYLAANGISARLAPDLSLGLSPPNAPPTRSGVMVTDSVLKESAQSLRLFAAEAGARHERMKPRTTVREFFYKRGRRLLRRGPLIRHWRPRSDPRAFAQRLSASELIVTGRFHSVLLAILTDTPFLAVASNTRKIEAVLTDVFGNTERLVTPAALEDPEFTRSLHNISPFSDAERVALARYRTSATAAHQKMFDTLVETHPR